MWWNEAFEIKVSQHSNVLWRISTGVKGRRGMKESLHEALQPWAWAKQMNMYLSRVKSQMYRICTRSRNEHQGHTHAQWTDSMETGMKPGRPGLPFKLGFWSFCSNWQCCFMPFAIREIQSEKNHGILSNIFRLFLRLPQCFEFFFIINMCVLGEESVFTYLFY